MTRTVSQVDSRLTTEINARAAADKLLRADLTGALARIAALEGPPVDPPAQTITVARGGKGIVIRDDGTVLTDLDITGPGANQYEGSFGIYGTGTKARPIRDVKLIRPHIRGFGHSGIWLEYFENLYIEDPVVDDVAYAGIMLISSSGKVVRPKVSRVGVTGYDTVNFNGYGIAVTMYSGSGAPSHDLSVEGWEVNEVPRWHGVDTHGGLRVSFTDGTARRCARAVFITAQAENEPPIDCEVSRNLLIEPKNLLPQGTDSNSAITLYKAVRGKVNGNVVDPKYPALINNIASLSTFTESGNVRGESR